MRHFIGLIAASAAAAMIVMFSSRSVNAWACDFLTGGGFIFTTGSGTHDEAKGTFAIGGGCKHGSPTWGHLEYHDHGNGLNAHWTDITAYKEESTSTDSKGRLIGTRYVCGTARTNTYGPVDFVVRATDNGEPGTSDEFDIRLSQGPFIVYSTEADFGTPFVPHKLGGGQGGGGNIQLHKPNPSNTGSFGGDCPALSAMFQ